MSGFDECIQRAVECTVPVCLLSFDNSACRGAWTECHPFSRLTTSSSLTITNLSFFNLWLQVMPPLCIRSSYLNWVHFINLISNACKIFYFIFVFLFHFLSFLLANLKVNSWDWNWFESCHHSHIGRYERWDVCKRWLAVCYYCYRHCRLHSLSMNLMGTWSWLLLVPLFSWGYQAEDICICYIIQLSVSSEFVDCDINILCY